MAENVDKRVVQVEFDNSKFDKNIKKSSAALKDFEEQLEMKGLTEGLEKVRIKFSALEVAAITAISNITTSVMKLGVNMVKYLSVDNISAGWSKFGDKTVAVATMASQTLKVAGKELTNYEEKIEAINEQLEKLNWFTDETSYNFTTMVETIGKFTAAGQDLDASVEAMMGIANWAAMSGQNASRASGVMYQLAQAMGKGYIMVQDWQSVENASMATADFMNNVLEAAVAMGELTQQGEYFITKTGKKFERKAFRTALSDKWFTTDVLIKTLQKYSAAVDEIYEIAERENLTATQVIEKYSDQFDEFAINAFKAAQEARTFEDVINSIKDAVSTGFMNTFEYIFGGYDDAKKLWTDLSNELYDVFAEGGNFRNQILSLWNDLAGRKDLFEHGGSEQGAFWNIYDSVIAVRDTIRSAWDTIFPKSVFENQNDIAYELSRNLKTVTETIRDYTKNMLAVVSENETFETILKGIFSVLKVGLQLILGITYALSPIVDMTKNIVSNVFDRIAIFINNLGGVDALLEKIENVSRKIYDVISSLIETLHIEEVINFLLDGLGALINIIGKLIDYVKGLDVSFDGVKDSFKDFGEGFMNSISSIFGSSETIEVETSKRAKMAKRNITNAVNNTVEYVEGFSKSIISVKEMTEMTLETSFSWSGLLHKFVEATKAILTSLQSFIEGVSTFAVGVWSLIAPVINLLGVILKFIGNILIDFSELVRGVSDEFRNSAARWASFVSVALVFGIAIIVGLKVFYDIFYSIKSSVVPLLYLQEQLADALERWSRSSLINSIGSIIKDIGASLLMMALSMYVIANIPKETFARAAIVFGLLLGFISAFIATILVFLSKTNKMVTTLEMTWKKTNVRTDKLSDYAYQISTMLISMSVALLVIVGVMHLLADMDAGSMWTTFGVVALLLITMTGAMVSIMHAASFMAKHISNKTRETNNQIAMFEEIRKFITKFVSSIVVLIATMAALTAIVYSQGDTKYLIAVFGVIEGIMGTLLVSILALITAATLMTKYVQKTGNTLKILDYIKKFVTQFITSLVVLLIAVGSLTALIGNQGSTEYIYASLGVVVGIMGAILVSMLALMTAATIMTNYIKKPGSTIKILEVVRKFINTLVASLVVLMIAIGSLASLMYSQGSTEYVWNAVYVLGSLAAGLIIMVDSLAAIAAFNKMNNITQSITKMSWAFFIISLSLNLLVAAIISLSIVPKSDIWRSVGVIGAIAGVIAALGAVLAVLRYYGITASSFVLLGVTFMEIATALVIFNVALQIFIDSIYALEAMDWPLFGKMAATMAVLLVALAALGAMAPAAPGILILSQALIGLSVALLIIVTACSALQNVNIGAMLKALAILAVMMSTIGLLSLLSIFAPSMVALGSALIVLATGIALLSASLVILSEVTWSTIWKGLGMVAVYIGALAIASLLVAPIIPLMLALAGVIVLLGVGLFTTAMAMIMMSTSMVTFVQTFVDNLELFKEAASGFGSIIMEALTGAITSLFSNLGEMIDSLSELGKALLDFLVTIFVDGRETLFEVMYNLFGMLWDIIAASTEPMIEAIGGLLLALFKWLASKAEDIGQIIMDVIIAILQVLSDNIGRLVKVLVTFLVNLIAAVIQYGGPLAKALLELAIFLLREFAKSIVTISAELTKIILTVIATSLYLTISALYTVGALIVELIGAFITMLYQIVSGMSSVIFEFFRSVFWMIVDLLVQVVNFVAKDGIKAIVAVAASFIAGIIDGLADVLIAAGGIGEWIGNWIKDNNVMSKMADGLVDQVAVSGQNIADAIAKTGKNMSNALTTVTDAMTNTLDAGIKSIGTATTKAIDILGSDVTDMFTDKTEETSENVFDTIIESIDENTGDVENAVLSGVDTVADKANNAVGSLFTETGQQAANGLADGMREKGEEVGNAAGDMAQNAVDKAKSVLDVHSPSRVFAEIGRFIDQGLALGIEGASSEPVDVTYDTMAEVINAAAESLQDLEDNDDLVITPVLDLSNITEGANDIAALMSSVNGSAVSVNGNLANRVNSEINARRYRGDDTDNQNGTTNNYGGDTFYSTFNITSNDPEAVAEEVDRMMQSNRTRLKLAKGG